MIGYYQALAIVLAHSHRLPGVACPTAQALGRILASPVVSPVDLPPFDNSAMDGFALCAAGMPAAAAGTYAVHGTQAAGDALAQAAGGAWEIMTGARLPAGLDSVAAVEQVEVVRRDAAGRPLAICLEAAVPCGQHVRRRGEDVARDALVMAAGDLVQAQHLAVLVALGVAEVAVVRRPRLAVICTGRELVDDPRQPLASGQIRNSNGPFLAARAALAGAEVVHRQTVDDAPAALEAALGQALQAGADIVLSSGAVSMGRHDFVPQTLRGLGASVHFHKVRMRPGKPLLFASLPGGALYFGLPGNPVASAVGMRFLVEPALRRQLGMALEQPLRLPLGLPFDKHVALRCFLKGRAALDRDGRLCAAVLPGQESFRLRPLLDANAWVVAAEDLEHGPAGSLVDVYGLGHLQPPMMGALG